MTPTPAEKRGTSKTRSSARRAVRDARGHEDPTSADILPADLDRMEEFSWMVSAEHRTP